MPPDGEDAVEPPPVPVTPSHTTTSGHVALVLPTAEGGGAERSMVRLANGLHRAGITVDLVLGTAEGEYVDEIAAGVNVIDLRSKRMSSAVPGLVRYLRSRRPTAAVATLPHGNVALAIASRLARTGTRVYLREASTPSELTYGRFDVRDRVTGSLVALAYRQAHGVIAVSNGVATDLHEQFGVPRERIHVIANPVIDADVFELAAEELPFAPFGADTAPVIMGAGRLIADKGFDTLLRAFATVRSQVDARLLILGEGQERAALEGLARDLDLTPYVSMPGFVQNPYAFMARASLFVLSSRREGLPGVLIQAMACGCPVVSTDCKSGPDEVLEGGTYGMLVPVGDDAAMAAAMLTTLAGDTDVEALKRRALDYTLEESVEAFSRLLL